MHRGLVGPALGVTPLRDAASSPMSAPAFTAAAIAAVTAAAPSVHILTCWLTAEEECDEEYAGHGIAPKWPAGPFAGLELLQHPKSLPRGLDLVSLCCPTSDKRSRGGPGKGESARIGEESVGKDDSVRPRSASPRAPASAWAGPCPTLRH